MNMNDPITQAIVWPSLVILSILVAHFWTETHESMPIPRWRQFTSRYVRRDDQADDDQADDQASAGAVSLAKLNSENGETMQHNAESASETITLGERERIEAETLARLVLSDIIGVTDAVRIGMQAKSGDKYSRKTRLLQAEIARQKTKYPDRSAEQKDARERLQLD